MKKNATQLNQRVSSLHLSSLSCFIGIVKVYDINVISLEIKAVDDNFDCQQYPENETIVHKVNKSICILEFIEANKKWLGFSTQNKPLHGELLICGVKPELNDVYQTLKISDVIKAFDSIQIGVNVSVRIEVIGF